MNRLKCRYFRFRFRLRSLLIIVTVCAVTIGWRAEFIARHKRAVAHFANRGVRFVQHGVEPIGPNKFWRDHSVTPYLNYISRLHPGLRDFLVVPKYGEVWIDCNEFTDLDCENLSQLIGVLAILLVDPTDRFDYRGLGQIDTLVALAIIGGRVTPTQLDDISTLNGLTLLSIIGTEVPQHMEVLHARLQKTEIEVESDDGSTRDTYLSLIRETTH